MTRPFTILEDVDVALVEALASLLLLVLLREEVVEVGHDGVGGVGDADGGLEQDVRKVEKIDTIWLDNRTDGRKDRIFVLSVAVEQ